jgi:hypothetical protein
VEFIGAAGESTVATITDHRLSRRALDCSLGTEYKESAARQLDAKRLWAMARGGF